MAMDFDRSTSITGSKLTKVVRVNSSRNGRLLERAYDVVVATNREGDAGSRELLAEVTNFLEVHYPNITIELRDDDHPWSPPLDSCKKTLRARSLRRVAVAGGLRLFSVSLEPRLQVGTTLDDIHRPVPSYDVELSRPTNAFFERLKPSRSFWRLNWTLIDSPALHQPTSARRSPTAT